MEVEWLEETHGAIWESQLELAVSEVHLECVALVCDKFAIWVVHISVPIDLHLIVLFGTLIEVDWTLLFSVGAESVDLTPIRTIRLVGKVISSFSRFSDFSRDCFLSEDRRGRQRHAFKESTHFCSNRYLH